MCAGGISRDLPLAISRLYHFDNGEENFHLMNVVTRVRRPVERLVHFPFGMSLIPILQRQAA
jgi:hypothetical protein